MEARASPIEIADEQDFRRTPEPLYVVNPKVDWLVADVTAQVQVEVVAGVLGKCHQKCGNARQPARVNSRSINYLPVLPKAFGEDPGTPTVSIACEEMRCSRTKRNGSKTRFNTDRSPSANVRVGSLFTWYGEVRRRRSASRVRVESGEREYEARDAMRTRADGWMKRG
ncbi:hypothetical protein LX32DRAFT_656990 [Colletotrichum zoysiae]|uniref:Uncharacterized protein n=1 Tax=Colletotrichum zoysiae TaxID=1216348 RepID=A0AAD9LWI9_9PEZI|nr:hypothetical protein LX32DRAFT_656990 [Colletotrichum zoysiae]